MWKKQWKALALPLLLVLAACGGNPQLVVCTRATVTLNLNSGFDQVAANPLPDASLDNEWWITQDPDPTATVPRMATVVPNYWGGLWVNAGQFPNSKWIAPNPSATPYNDPNNPLPNPIFYEYTYYFTLPNGASSPSLSLKLNADDGIEEVKLNGHILYTFTSPGGNFGYPPLTVNTTNPSFFNYGASINTLSIKVRDTHRSITGLIVEGSVTYTDCCREPIQLRPEVQSLTFYEGTGSIQSITLTKTDPKLLARLANLTSTSYDFAGVPDRELYDVFYSDWDGTPNPNGAFITIEATYDGQLPSGGGLNIARVTLNTTNGSIEADSVMSFVGLGDNYIPMDVVKAVDGNPNTGTTMGNTVGARTQRLRITLGFPCCKP